MTTILLVEDNETLALGLRSNLEFEGYEVLSAATAADGLALAARHRPDLMILDLMLPDSDGFRVLRELRAREDEVPILVLTALGEEADKLRGFRFGADDYVTKPFALLELMARVDALLRRARGPRRREAPDEWRFGDVVVDLATRAVQRRGKSVSLRPREYELLVALLKREGRLASRIELLREVWGYDDSVMSRTVDTHVAELRRKLEPDPAHPRFILTVLKGGYRLSHDGCREPGDGAP